MAFATLRTATCITCSSVFDGDLDEDGAPEIPGQRCAIAECERWICTGGCAEHHSLHCRTCGRRVCEDHAVTRRGWDPMCRTCADDLIATCRECCAAPVEHRYADGLGTCDPCHRDLRRSTQGLPDCPECGHRFGVRDMDERLYHHGNRTVVERPGRMYRCSCGLKFTREAAGEKRKGPQSVEAARPQLFARM